MQSIHHLNCCVIRSFTVTQVGLYHDQQAEDGGSSKENRNIYSESMPRRVGSFYRGLFGVSMPLHSDQELRTVLKTPV